jgi:glycosyltransferase involved in cell wall biosynthesis
MHNSGTSLAGSLLHASGAPMGDRLLLRHSIEATHRPRYDYFEDEEVVALQDTTLLGLQRHWSSYRASFPLPAAGSVERMRFRQQLTALVQRRLRRQRLWVVKDPRIGVLLEDWVMVLQALNVTVQLLIVHRDPDSNVRSFSSKGRVPTLWAEALWQRTYANALAAAGDLVESQVAFARFTDLVTRPVDEAQRFCRFLQWPEPVNLAERVAAVVDPSLPTQTRAPNSGEHLQPFTLSLQGRLGSGCMFAKPPQEHELLAHQIELALTPNSPWLELNAREAGGQSLLPKLRIGIVTAELQGWGPCGGIGSAYRELALALCAAGHGVKVLLVAPGAREAKDPIPGVEVQQLNSNKSSRLELARRVAAILHDDPADVVHLHDWLGLGSGLREYLGSDGPLLIVGLHGPSSWTRLGNPWPRSVEGALAVDANCLYEEGLVRALEQDTLQHADLLVSPSRFMADWVRRQLLSDSNTPPIAVQRNCALSARILAGSGTYQPSLVFFGRLEERKGLLLFLDALERMPQPAAQVIFLGQDCRISEQCWGSAVARTRLEALAIPCQFQGNLQRADALQWLRELNPVVVIPSLIENSPCAVEELLESGLRLVVTNVGGCKELVAESCTHWLSAAEPEALAQHLHAALTLQDPQAYQLHARVPAWSISLSWQAFHERLPRRLSGEQPQPDTRAAQRPLSRVARWVLQRGLHLSRRLAQWAR